jgi:hypothetical protein
MSLISEEYQKQMEEIIPWYLRKDGVKWVGGQSVNISALSVVRLAHVSD